MIIFLNLENEASPITSIVLKIFGQDMDSVVATSMWICQVEHQDAAHDSRLRTSLNCLYRWLWDWPCTDFAADWTLGFIKELEVSF